MKLWSTTEIARKLGVGSSSVRRALVERKIPVFVVGNRWKVEESEALALIEAVRKEKRI